MQIGAQQERSYQEDTSSIGSSISWVNDFKAIHYDSKQPQKF